MASNDLENLEAEYDQHKSQALELETQLTTLKSRFVEIEQQNLAINQKNIEFQEKLSKEQNSKFSLLKTAEKELDEKWQLEVKRITKLYDKKIWELECEIKAKEAQSAAVEHSMHDALLKAKREAINSSGSPTPSS